MQLFAITFVCLIVTLGLHGCLGRPSRDKLGLLQQSIGRHAGKRNCRVADFQVQPDFQLDLYIGTWYHIAQNHLQHGYQRRSHYSLLEDGSGLSMRATRVSRGCHTFDFEARSRLEDLNMPAKMILSIPLRPLLRDNYWVLYTDYTNMAIIYSCNILTEFGTCDPDGVKLWVIGRTIELTDAQLQRVEHVMEEVCLDFSALHLVPKDCDSSLGISSVSEFVITEQAPIVPEQGIETGDGDKFKEVPQSSCVVDEFSVHKNLNVNKYLGTWFTVAQIGSLSESYQRKAVYSLTDDGSIEMATQIISTDGECTVNEAEAIALLPDGSSSMAKLLMNITTMEGTLEDYWVLHVEYDDHAVWYSCRARKEDGTCYDWATHLWVISRSPLPLSDEERSHVNEVLKDVCIDPAMLKDIPTDCDGAIGLPTGDKKNEEIEEIISTEEVEISCIVDDFKVQEDFVVEKFLGEWFSIKHKNPSIYQQQTSFRSMIFSASKNKTASHMEVIIQDIKIGTECGIAENQAGLVWVDEIDPAKFSVSFQTLDPDGHERDAGGWNFWIMATDYDSYAIAYACHVIGEFYTCDLKSEELWVLSRTPTFEGNQFEYLIENAVQYVCMEPDDLVDNGEPCQTSLNTELKQDPVIPDNLMAPADFTSRRTCDPSLTQYGCCLLEDKPAAGPQYEGCPRAPPAVAGQPLPGEPQEIQQPGECDEKIICRLGCEHGFARDAYGCEICMCADQPKEQDAAPAKAAHLPIPQARRRHQQTECEQQRNFMQNFVEKTGQTTEYYLPVCDARGLFEVSQCYAGTNVCWCVHSHTGAAIEC